jgi:hypothetical protein
MDDDDTAGTYDEIDRDAEGGESWLAEQARLVLAEDGS